MTDAFKLGNIIKPHHTIENNDSTTNTDTVIRKTEDNATEKDLENELISNEPVSLEESAVSQVFTNSISVENGKITVKVINFPVVDLLNTIFEKMGRKILINGKIQGRVSVILNYVQPEELLSLLSENLGFNWTQKNGVFIVSTENQLISPDFFPVKYADLNDIKNALSALGLGNKLIINSYPRGLLVNASPDKIRDVSNIIEKLDTLAPSIKVEFKIMELNKGEQKKLGISWQDVTSSYQYNNQSISSSAITTITKNITTGTVSTANETNSIGKILSKPYIITLNNIEAHLSTGDEVPIFSRDANGNPSVEYKKVGIELYTTPSVVNIDDKILNIKAKTIVNIISGQQTQQGLTAPQISSREAQTTMNVKSGETIVIGGLLKEEDIRSEVGIPLLDKLPIIGGLFKNTNKSKATTEILIFITPTLVSST